MPHIKPFCGIRPAQEYVEQLIAAPADLPLDDAAAIRLSANPYSFLHLVAPPPESEFLQGSREVLVYKKAAENLQRFLDEGVLIRDEQPQLYLYSVEGDDDDRRAGGSEYKGGSAGNRRLKTGIWAVTLFDDYLNNHIKKHEYTRVERENSIAGYIRQTGIDSNPVLIARRQAPEIDRIVQEHLLKKPLLSFMKGEKEARRRHLLHGISSPEDIRALVDYFQRLPAAYLADGHHRAAAFSSYGVERRKFNFKHTGLEEYNYFSSIYFPAADLEIKPFNRLVKDLNGLSAAAFLEKLSGCFRVEKQKTWPRPQPGRLGLYLTGQWYRLSPAVVNPDAVNPAAVNPDALSPDAGQARDTGDPVHALDVSLLQDRILGPLLGIDDPRRNERLRFSGGTPPGTLAAMVDAGDAAALFTLSPTTIQQLMNVADAGMVMPPKSTWFEPKLDLGILTHYVD